MKKIMKTIKLHRFRTELNKSVVDKLAGQEFVVTYQDNTWEKVYYKEDLIPILNRDDKKPIHYIFDMTDRIIVDREILINPINIFERK